MIINFLPIHLAFLSCTRNLFRAEKFSFLYSWPISAIPAVQVLFSSAFLHQVAAKYFPCHALIPVPQRGDQLSLVSQFRLPIARPDQTRSAQAIEDMSRKNSYFPSIFFLVFWSLHTIIPYGLSIWPHSSLWFSIPPILLPDRIIASILFFLLFYLFHQFFCVDAFFLCYSEFAPSPCP